MQPCVRQHDWDRRLRIAVEDAHDRKFRWGDHDCCLFAARLVEAMTGCDPAKELRGAYSNELEAARIICHRGGMTRLVSDLLRAKCFYGYEVMRGDVVLLRPLHVGHLEQVGVCIGDSAVVAAEVGILYRPMRETVCAWRLD